MTSDRARAIAEEVIEDVAIKSQASHWQRFKAMGPRIVWEATKAAITLIVGGSGAILIQWLARHQ
jgi:hypothetical protein